MTNRAAILSFTLFAACGPGSFTGTVKGNKLEPVESVFLLSTETSLNFSTGTAVSLVMSDKPNLCSRLLTNTTITKGETRFAATLGTTDGNAKLLSTVATGKYPIISWN